MSIIERAAGRLGKGEKKTDAGQTSPSPAQTDIQDPASPVTPTVADVAQAGQASVSVSDASSQAGVVTPRPPAAGDQTATNADHGSDAHAAVNAAPDTRDTRRARSTNINLNRLHEMGLVTPLGGRTGMAEEFRIIKRPLLRAAFEPTPKGGNPGNLIMVTSALPGEGKSFCALNLAMSIALELDHTVMLVDADVARPSLMRTLGIHADVGLMDLLIDDKLDLGDVLLRTNVDKLSVVPSGRKHIHSTELLASQTMSHFLHEIASRYSDRIIIFDSPPLLLTSEARVLASQMGQIVVVVEAETTTQRAVAQALEQLETCPNVSLIYNKSRDQGSGDQYGYHYD